MQIFTNLCNVLTAASQYFKQLHLCAAQGGYSLHLLTNKIYNDLDEANDRLKELSISVSSNKKITIALNSLEAAANFCRQIPDSTDTQNIQLMINNCTLILEDLGLLVERASAEVSAQEIIFKQGLLNALGDISEKLAKDKYLLNMELSPLSAPAQDEFDENKHPRGKDGKFRNSAEILFLSSKEEVTRKADEYIKTAQVIDSITGTEFEGNSLEEKRSDAEAWAEANLYKNPFKNKSLGRDIKVLNIGKAISQAFNAEKLNFIKHLPKVLTESQYIGSREDGKNRPNVKGFHYFACKLNIGGKPQGVIISVREDNNGNIYYNHILRKNIIQKSEDEAVSLPAPYAGAPAPSSIDSITDNLEKINIYYLGEFPGNEEGV